MAVRTASEIITNARSLFGEQTPDGFVQLLEDITDSVQGVNMDDYVSRQEYLKVEGERDAAIKSRDDFRDRYINRFYSDYSAPNDRGYIHSEAPQSRIERDEEDVSYNDLFE